MDWQERITSDPEVLVGKPTIKGTRLAVEFILGRLADGWTQEEVLDSYPRLTKQDLQAVFSYATECIKARFIAKKDLRGK